MQSSSQNVTTNKPSSSLLQAGYPDAFPVAQPWQSTKGNRHPINDYGLDFTPPPANRQHQSTALPNSTSQKSVSVVKYGVRVSQVTALPRFRLPSSLRFCDFLQQFRFPGAQIMGVRGVLTPPLKICRMGWSMPRPPKVSHSFTQNRCWITLQAPQHEGWKTCVKNGRQNHFSRQLKQFDGLAQLTPTPWFYDRSTLLPVPDSL